MLKLHAQFALMFSLEELFCSVDDFCKGFEPQWKQQLLGSGLQLRKRQRSLNLSEIMTMGNGSGIDYYASFLSREWRNLLRITYAKIHFPAITFSIR